MSSSRDPAREPLLPLHGSSRAAYDNGSTSASASRPPTAPSSSIPPPETPVSITIRFASSSLPDLSLTIQAPYSTNISTLKRLIRTSLPVETGRRRLRLIYGGKVLGDKANIGQALGVSRLASTSTSSFPKKEKKQPPPPPKRTSRKGKEVIRPDPEDDDYTDKKDAKTSTPTTSTTSTTIITGVYVHCSIGDELTDEDLAEEAETESQAIHHPSTLPAPQGFDRLLNAGFTESDIAALRSQFHGTLLNNNNNATSIDGTSDPNASSGLGFSLLDEESRRHALALEERWIDESATNEAETGDATVNTESGGLEDTLIGVMWGFFWPLCIVWMLREEGTLGNSKRQLAVIAGLLMNCVFGLLKLGSAG
ncbi:hypothetical protein TWF106_002052 [Orbilia oligospora]|uniref:Ubiquitin-like domain-containing protein n=1 Tax=Orbilia oligospora TaxID=2813651 RepID=A0A7C8UD09_ORBOL|nr:hypothetical protein TWF788_001469 [Orbilia oligospora]KAF3203235.1 hypothetical protein TWF106_002052 [Orbilia oligospora]